MNLKRFIFLVASTVAVGIVTGILVSITGINQLPIFYGFQAGGFTSATALMGFWAYLTLNFIVRGLLPWRLWIWTQVLLVAWVYGDMSYLRYINEGKVGSIWPYIAYATWPLVWALIVGYCKSRQTGTRSFVPAVFFMYVFTTIEWYVALKTNWTGLVTTIGIVLLACNSYMILMFAKLLKPSPK